MLRTVSTTEFVVYFCLIFATTCSDALRFLIEPNDTGIVFEHGSTDVQTLVLSCAVSGLESSQKVSWLKNGGIISDGVNVRRGVVDNRYSISGEYNLRISPINIFHGTVDEGQYICAVLTIDNESDVLLSRQANVHIYITPRAIFPQCLFNDTESSGEITVLSGSTVFLSCQSDLGTPRVSLDWYVRKSGGSSQLLPATDSGINNEGLTFIKYGSIFTSSHQRSVFSCHLQHPGFSIPGHERANTNCTIGPFNVLHPPEVTLLSDENVSITSEYSTANFHCITIANPSVSRLVWSYDNDPVTENNSRFIFRNNGQNLTIFGFNIDDNGVHNVSCTAENDYGNGTDVVSVLVAIREPHTSTTPKMFSPKTVSSTTIHSTKNSNTPAPQRQKNANLAIYITIPLCVVIIALVAMVVVLFIKFRRRKSSEPSRDQSRDQDFNSFTNETCTVESEETVISEEIKNWDTDTYMNVSALQIYENSRSTTESLESRTDDDVTDYQDKNEKNREEAIYTRRNAGEELMYLHQISQPKDVPPVGWVVEHPDEAKSNGSVPARRSRRGEVFYI